MKTYVEGRQDPWIDPAYSRLIVTARIFANAAHAAVGQIRRYTGEPYIVHPEEVLSILQTVEHYKEQAAAALLHDVLEDTKVGRELILQFFGPDVTKLVEELTDVSRPEDGNRATRKALDRAHIAQASPRAKTIKLADCLSNAKNVIQYDPQFATVFIPEIELLWPDLRDGDQFLWRELGVVIADWRAAKP